MKFEVVNGLKTVFYDGRQLCTEDSFTPIEFDKKERDSWEQIIVLNDVSFIPAATFYRCRNLKRIVFARSVRRISSWAFCRCDSLVEVVWSQNIEYIGEYSFLCCTSLVSVFIPPSCLEVDDGAFCDCEKLEIFQVPPTIRLGEEVILGTKLLLMSSFYTVNRHCHELVTSKINAWIRNQNNEGKFKLHRLCSSYNPTSKKIFEASKIEDLLFALQVENDIGVTPMRYLDANPYSSISEMELTTHLIMKMISVMSD